MYQHLIKPFFDRMSALIACLIFLPVMLLIMVLLMATGHRSLFFTQPRIGKNNRSFRVLKFKTMTDKKDADGNLLPDAERLTSFGKFLRKSSLDELPQLLNVLKGDMSLVGPRPLLPQYLPLYNETQRRRHLVKPGITGWAQVNGRNAISWTKKFELDVWYVEHQSFGLDLKILFLTFQKIVAASDINQAGQATMEAFNGKN
ncbi:MAG TPA: sugar transferase [Ferruginibacter sp.]|nr:sugar transferase [Ferruginibacter sp.]HRN80342.1 sugar transferase [Ferruginibacter sp.]HRO17810.1 sugar transferase [Ferruginibacter sp.]HRQ21245.1 sugar transferase [Ferruginibacter sp.]